MKSKIVIALSLMLAGATVSADEYVRGYYRKDGTYVAPHVRSSPNQYKWDNYGSSSKRSNRYSYDSPYTRDSDGDGIYNQYDLDDNNNGIPDDNE